MREDEPQDNGKPRKRYPLKASATEAEVAMFNEDPPEVDRDEELARQKWLLRI